MIRKILTILIAVFNIMNIYAQKTDVEIFGYKGLVKSVKEVKCNYKDVFGVLTRGECRIMSKYLFTNEVQYNADGSPSATTYFYKKDTNGRLYSSHVYNSDWNLVEENDFYNNNLDNKIINKYDSEGKIVEKNHYSYDGSFRNKTIYNYNSEGYLIMRKEYNSNGSVLKEKSYKYNKGNLTQTSTQEGHYGRYKYNSDGNVREFRKTREYSTYSEMWLYKYDSVGNQIQSDYLYKGELKTTTLYKYDSNGNKIEESNYKNEIMIPVSISEFIIEYYN